MIRSLLIISTVATVSYFLSNLERSYADRNPQLTWVRTVDGWEPSHMLHPGRPSTVWPKLHPALVASFMLGSSLFVLIAFPRRDPAVGKTAPRQPTRPAKRRGHLSEAL